MRSLSFVIRLAILSMTSGRVPPRQARRLRSQQARCLRFQTSAIAPDLRRDDSPARERAPSLAAAAVVLLLAGCAPIVAPPPIQPATDPPVAAVDTASPAPQAAPRPILQEYPVPSGSRPHDVAPAPDGSVWYTAQGSGELGVLDPATGHTRHIPLGRGSAPHGVIVGPDGAAWITDGGQNAIVRVDPRTDAVKVYPLGTERNANLNTASFDGRGVLWFTGQNGYYGRVDPKDGSVKVWEAPRGRGPYGIATRPDGSVYYVSLAGGHLARIDLDTGQAAVLEPPTPGQGTRRVWSDSTGRLWVSEWNSGQLSMHDPSSGQWRAWKLPGAKPQPYAVYVDSLDLVWVSDFGANAMVRFDPRTETFETFELSSPNANVRQILGRPGEVWGAESGASKILVLRAG